MPDFDFDAWIDAQLRNVPLPPDLLAQLAKTGGPNSDDPRLDAVLRHVPLPASMESRLRNIAVRQGPRSFWYRAGIAATMSAIIGLAVLGYLSLVAGASVGRPGSLQTPQHGPSMDCHWSRPTQSKSCIRFVSSP